MGITWQITRATPLTPQVSDASRHGYALTNGASALKRDDGSWIFWVRIINFDDPAANISATLQLATDRGFSQVIDSLPFTLTAAKSFIAQPVYKPKSENTQLFYRYLIGSNPLTSPSVSSIVNSISPWNAESKAE